jgi:hypothetical protein
MKEIIRDLKRQVKYNKDGKYDLNGKSWGYEYGVLISANDAEKILQAIKRNESKRTKDR